MRKFFTLFAIVVLCSGFGCRRSKGFEVPAEVGRGLSEGDSLRALLQWLEGQSGYAADTLRLHTLFELINAMESQSPDSAYALAQRLDLLAQRSTYPAARVLSRLGWSIAYLSRSAPDSAIAAARQALAFSEQAGYERLKADALRLMGLGYQRKSAYDFAITYYQQAIAIYESTRYKPGLALSYNSLGNTYYARAQYATALEFYRRALSIWESIGHKPGMATSYTNMGIIYYAQGQYEEAMKSYEKALQIREVLGDKRGMANLYNNIGALYFAQGRYAESLENHQKALAIREEIDHKRGLADSYNNIAGIYQAQQRYAEALDYYQKALSIWEVLGHKLGIAVVSNNIGGLYLNLKQYEEALKYHKKALAIREALGDKAGVAASSDNIGFVYESQGQYEKALEYYRRAVSIHEQIGSEFGLTFSYGNVGGLYLRLGQPYIARPYLLRALSIAQKLRAYDRLREIYLLLAATDSLIATSGQPAYWKTAYQYARLHTAYNDSLINKETIRKQAQLESQYEYEKKVALLKVQQEQERVLAQAEIRHRETERNLSLIIAGLTLTAAGVLGYFLRIIRRQKRELELANQRLEQTNKELEQANAELRTTNQALEESNRVIQTQAKTLVQKNEEILDSIRYAERIQRAILPSDEKWRRLLPDSFLLYLPRDIVAGDFYWLEETERYVFLGVADATGHGVPGAFVSLVCANALNKAVREEGLESPARILSRTKALVSELLTREGGKLPDGMDIALVRFDKAHPWQVMYAGANRPLWIVSNEKELIELTPTRQPVGYTYDDKPFEEVAVDLVARRPVMVYGFTDGVVDQIGGPKGRKLMTKGLKELLLGMADLPCEVQRERIEAFFTEWKGEMRQLDDVTLVGIRVG